MSSLTMEVEKYVYFMENTVSYLSINEKILRNYVILSKYVQLFLFSV